jgi:hypothetical protein
MAREERIGFRIQCRDDRGTERFAEGFFYRRRHAVSWLLDFFRELPESHQKGFPFGDRRLVGPWMYRHGYRIRKVREVCMTIDGKD